MSWTVLSVAYPLALVSEDSVGGAEQVLSMLDRALVGAGHRSIVIAAQGSRVSGTLVPLPAVPDQIDDAARAHAQHATRLAISATLAAEKVSLIHLHAFDFADYLPADDVPVLVTLHLPLDWYPAHALQTSRPRTYFNCVSASQAGTALSGTKLLEPIPNGVDLTRFQLRTHKQNFALMLGRICPEKGVDIALRACRLAGIPLLIGGQVYPYPAHQSYFQNEVVPLLDRCRRFLGPLALSRKAALLAAAKCVLIPSLAAETSSLVAMEALASGTPVISHRAGALSEIVEDGRTGFLVGNEQEMSQAIDRAGTISPEICRQQAVLRFGRDRTVRGYLDAYQAIVYPEGTT